MKRFEKLVSCAELTYFRPANSDFKQVITGANHRLNNDYIIVKSMELV